MYQINRSIYAQRRVVLLVLVLVSRLLGALVQAETLKYDCEKDPDCRSMLEQGQQANASGNFAEAERAFRAALARVADPALLFNIARMLHKQRRGSEALLYYSRYLEVAPDNSEQKRRAEDYRKELQGKDNEQAKELPLRPPLTLRTTIRPPKLPHPPLTPIDKQFYRERWFWMLLGGITTTIVTGLAVGLSSVPQRPTPLPDYAVYVRTF